MYKIAIFIVLIFFVGCGGGAGKKVSGDLSGVNNEQDKKSNNDDKNGVADKSAPVIELKGKKEVYLTLGERYVDPGATASDFTNEDISSLIKVNSNVDFSKAGTYSITYQVTDKRGKSAFTTRKVFIQDILNSPDSREGLTINEILAANTYTKYDPDFKQFSDWIELYNNSNGAKDIGGYYLSDDEKNLKKWRIPDDTIIGSKGYLLIWADKKDTDLHTNFSLNSDGEVVILSDTNGDLVDKIVFGKQKSDISCMKIDNKLYYMKPTPKSKNTIAHGELWLSKKPKFSLDGIFYDSTQYVKLESENGGKIYYTTDGSIPTESSDLYSSAIKIDKTTVIRARSFEKGKFLSKIANKTYFIGENISLPIVSLSIDEKYLYDKEYGIYTEGNHENFRQDWMRPASVEYIKNGESKFCENVGVRIYGGGSRVYPQKSLSIFAKDKYGPKSIKYQLFPDKPFIKKVKSFILRNGGNEWERTIFKDGMIHDMIRENMDIDYLSYQPSILFLNGEFWGIQNVREKPNEDYIKANHPEVDKDNLDILRNPMRATPVVSAGDAKAYTQMLDFIKTHDLANEANYEKVISQIDLNEYLNYLSVEIYTGNNDWPGNNVKYWRERTDNGKWRWILFDMDFGFDGYGHNSIKAALDENSTSLDNPPWSTFLFRNLMKNSDFKYRFVGRFLSHLYTTFDKDRVSGFITKHKKEIEPYIHRNYLKWKQKDLSAWEAEVDDSLYDFAEKRAAYIKDFFADELNLVGNNSLVIEPSQNGSIYLEGIKIDKRFEGEYFNNSKVTIKAVPNDGYKFVSWTGINAGNRSQIDLVVNGDADIAAVFELK